MYFLFIVVENIYSNIFDDSKKVKKKTVSSFNLSPTSFFYIRITDFLVHVVFKCLKYSQNKGAKITSHGYIFLKKSEKTMRRKSQSQQFKYTFVKSFFLQRLLQSSGLLRIKSMQKGLTFNQLNKSIHNYYYH